jgi:hypothetical protein
MKVNIRFDFGCKLVRGNSEKYSHSFGGDFHYDGVVPVGCSIPLDLLYRLDLSDPMLPFTIESDFRFLPFFFPLSYDGSPLSYRVLSDNEIEILALDTPEPTPDLPCARNGQPFDFVPIRVEPITYQEQRDITMYWWFFQSHPELYESIPPDEIQRFKSLGYPPTRIGHTHELLQYPRGESCPNPMCYHCKERYWLRTIASIPERPFFDLDIWQADGEPIQIVYEICELCGSIRTYNICT